MGRILTGLKYGFVIGAVLILFWYFWAVTQYKYNLDRIGGIMLSRYQALNLDKLTDSTYFNYANVVLASDDSYATADMQTKDSVSQNVLSSEQVKYTLSSACDLTDINCINI